jgi:hypothetical protein
VEELIWRVSRNELVLIIYLGGFLGRADRQPDALDHQPAGGAARVELNDETLRDGLQSPSVTDPPIEEKIGSCT